MNYLLKKHIYLIIVLISLLAVCVAVLLYHAHSKSIADSRTNCLKQVVNTATPLKLSMTDPSKFTGEDLKEFVRGDYTYVYYFIADGSQSDTIGKPYPEGEVVFKAPPNFRSSVIYKSDVKPALDEIASLSIADKQAYLMGQNFHDVVANAINTFNKSQKEIPAQLCSKPIS